MTLTEYFPVFVQVCLAVGIAVGILAVSHVFGQRSRKNAIKDSPYECGFLPIKRERGRFAVKFYVSAMLFIIFDIEIVFLLSWALTYREFLHWGIPILMPVLFFLFVLVVGLVYEVKKDALVWEK